MGIEFVLTSKYLLNWDVKTYIVLYSIAFLLPALIESYVAIKCSFPIPLKTYICYSLLSSVFPAITVAAYVNLIESAFPDLIMSPTVFGRINKLVFLGVLVILASLFKAWFLEKYNANNINTQERQFITNFAFLCIQLFVVNQCLLTVA